MFLSPKPQFARPSLNVYLSGTIAADGTRSFRDFGSSSRRFGRDLREHYEVPRDLPPNLLALVRKLDDNG
jgi:hypothetical protein